ncbi:MAG: ABC transporter permease [Acidimicrobiales bacterium]
MRVILRRLGYLVPVMLVVTFVSFMLIKLLPGDPAILKLGTSATPEAIKALHHEHGLDRPLVVQYASWLGHLVRGDLGRSYISNQPVMRTIRQQLPTTVELLLVAQLLALALAVPAAIYAAYRPNRLFDRISTSASFSMLALPAFVSGVFLVYVFAIRLHVFPASGWTPISQNLGENLRTVALPAITLALPLVAAYLRLLRSDLMSTLQEDFITMARSKGLPTWRVLLRHAFRPSTFSLVTVIGLNTGALVGGALIVEVIFALPGIGALAVTSVFQRDYLVVQGTIVLVALGYVLVNFLVDVIYAIVDPRVRHGVA